MKTKLNLRGGERKRGWDVKFSLVNVCLPTLFTCSEMFLIIHILKFFYWSRVYLQCFTSSEYIAKWFSYTYIHFFFQDSLPICVCVCVYQSLSHVQFFVTHGLYSLPGFSVHGVLQARTLLWVAIALSRGSSQPRDRTQVSCIAGRFFIIWATREAPFTP